MCSFRQSSWLQLLVAALTTVAMHPRATVAFSISMSVTSPIQQSAVPGVKTNNKVTILESATGDDSALRKMQQKHRPIASSFVPNKFNPHPVFSNCHFQTISGVFLRKTPGCAYMDDSGVGGVTKVLSAMSNNNKEPDDECTFWDERQRITTSCEQDFFTVDIKYAGKRKTRYQSEDSNGIVVLIHGLESNSNSSLSTDMASAYLADGRDVVCINFRGCCGLPSDSIRGYHIGFTEDLRHFLKLISELWENNDSFDKRPMYLSGFSLGANVVVKCLGELGDAAMSLYNIQGAAVMGAPFDCERNIKCLDAPGFNRVVYGGNFLKSMKRKAQEQLDAFCDGDPDTQIFDYKGVMAATTVAEFDDTYIAKIFGYEDNIDYYRCNSCYYYLPGVAVPLLIINAGDDPFFDPDFFPFEESIDGGSLAPIKMERTKHGGHLGFMFHQLSDTEKRSERPASWTSMELARFVSHVHQYESVQ